MAAKKIYAVKCGRTPGIYNNWDDCRKQIDGFSGATYKSFTDINEAAVYMGFTTERNASVPNTTKSDEEHEPLNLLSYTRDNPTHGIAYVDGSYNINTKEFSYGVVMFINGREIHLSQKYNDKELSTMRNVAGEIMGSKAAMEYALKNKLTSISIYHDYEGISKWCLGYWKANKEGTIAYKDYYDSIKNLINIEFIKVKGHSGNEYNDLADHLAKEAVGIDY